MLRNKIFLSTSSLFFATTGIYLLRPVRDSLVVSTGITNLPVFFSATLICILIIHVIMSHVVCTQVKKRQLLQQITLVIIPLVGFSLFPQLIRNTLGDYLFILWASVISLSTVSMVWDNISNFFSRQEAKLLFAKIALGGTLGNITGYLGSLCAGSYSLILALITFFIAFILAKILPHVVTIPDHPPPHTPSIQKTSCSFAFSPFLFGSFLFVYSLISTFLYMEQALMVSVSHSIEDFNTQFSLLGVLSSIVALFLQLFFISVPAIQLGWRKILRTLPIILIIGMCLLAFSPSTELVAIIMAIHRCSSFVFLRPAREIWFAGIGKENKSIIKNFMDTVVYRSGDVAGGWLFILLMNMKLSIENITIVLAVITLMWFLIIFHFTFDKKITAFTSS